MSRNGHFDTGAGSSAYRVVHQPELNGGTSLHAIHADGSVAGSLHLHRGGRVQDVDVEKEHRRKGVATLLWAEAKRRGFDPKHSDDQTAAGARWASKVGD